MHERNFTTNVPKILDLKSSSEQIFSRKLSLGAPAPFLHWAADALSRSSPLIRLLILALCRSLSCCASDKLYLKRYLDQCPRTFVHITNTNESFFLTNPAKKR